VTHHLPRDTDSPAPWHLPGRFVGGAEMTDQAYIDAAPAGVEVARYGPEQWQAALDADHIIVTGTDLLSDEAMMMLADRQPVVFLHHAPDRNAARKRLIDRSSLLLVHTPAHLKHELQWTTPRTIATVLSPMDPTECRVGVKERFALWVNRMHPRKGPLAAKVWAAEQDIPLVMLSTAPRAEVLETMSRAEYFVHLPRALESESRATIEAVLSGCTVVANDNVGLTSLERWQDRSWLAEQVSHAGTRFWQLAL
jgi:hypothetical protein